MKFRPHGTGQDEKLATFRKVHGMIISKIQARYENAINIADSIRASEIMDIDGMAPNRKIYEDTYVKYLRN